MKMTSAYANKILRQLNEEKEYWVTKEKNSCIYVATVGEEPVIPEYDYEDVKTRIYDLDRRIAIIKHAINVANVTTTLTVGENKITIDSLLVRMAQLNHRKNTVDKMRQQLPKSRNEEVFYGRRATPQPEYQYTNYDLDEVQKEFASVTHEIMEMQIALDRHNQTYEFEVAI